MQVFCPHIVTNLLYFSCKNITFYQFYCKQSHAPSIRYTIFKNMEAFMGDLSNCGCNNDCNARSNNGCGCNNGCGLGFGGGNSIWWIIILIFFCGCGNGNSSNNGCGCGCDDNNNNCCSSIIWIILLSCICGNGSIF